MNTKFLKTGTFAIIAIMAFGCKNYTPMSMDKIITPLRTPTHSIQQLIAEFGRDNNKNADSDLLPIRSNAGGTGIFSVDTIPSVDTYGSEIIIAGRIITDDSQGNIYKYITIQDLQNPKYALKISINASGIGSWYPLGSVISVRCNGLVIGKYADMFQLGSVYFNNNANAAKTGYEPGRIPLPLFQVRVEIHSLPELDNIVVDTLTIAEILQSATDRSLQSRLVCIKNAYFTGEGVDYGAPVTLSDADKIFAPSTNGIGFPQSRVIRDGTGWVAVATSEYSRFCNIKIPASEYVGTITAIVAWYKDYERYDGNVQLTIRSLNDLNLYSTYDGSKWTPPANY